MLSADISRWLFLLISLSTWTKLIDSKEMRIVCYYTNWSVYRPGEAKFSPQNINPYLCTHLVYAFGGFTKENTLKPFDKYQDIEKGGYAKFIGLKTYNKNLKTMIAIGGWNEGSSRFSPMVASPERRKELVKNSIKFLRQNHFDGLDLDWEYPTFRDGGKPRDRDNYAQLVKELREEFERESEKTGRPRLLLTMAVPAGIEYINKGYDVPKLTKYLDWMNILSYDYHSAFEPAVNHHAPLYSLEEDNEYNYDAELNIDYTIKHYLKLGADPNKLVLGIPTYGRSYTLFNPDAYEIGSPADGPGDMGEATRENGYLAYYEVCEYIKDQDWEVDEPNPKAMGPIAFKDNQWVGYDDENIVRIKAEYVADNSLGGIMFWAIDNDDFRGNCHGRPYPLIEAAKEALLNAYGLTEDNLISPPSKPTKSSKQKSRNRTRKTTTTTTTEFPEESSVSTSSSSRRRIKSKSKNEDRPSSSQKRRKDSHKKEESSTYSSLKVITPAYTTPAPPATPDMGGAFKCEDEGFYSHPKDCKKYFWCLGGAGDTGIVAHQFTCPAGLYFNKAADSCDYSQNVLCDKKLQKATTTTTTETSDSDSETEKPTPSSIFSSSRVPPKITAATSKTTFRQTTTTEAYEDEYEYEDDEDEVKPEEDPKVIKALIDLIKKAGGIDELEKQFNFGKDSSSSAITLDSTTPSAISKSLVERVLGRSKNTFNAFRKAQTSRNSGGPQGSEFSEEQKEKKTDRGRPQYQTLSRQRSSTEKSADKEDTLEEPLDGEPAKEKKIFRNKSSLEYVNIRRPKSSSTTEASDDDEFNRNKILGETEDEDEDSEDSEEVTKKSSTPHYVNIRRTRPSTTEATPDVLEDEESNETDEESKYKIVRRGSTTESGISSGTSTSRYQTIRRGTTTSASIPEGQNESTRRQSSRGTTVNSKYVSLSRSSTPLDIEESNDSTSKYQTIRRGPTTLSGVSTSELPTSTPQLKIDEINSATENEIPITTILQETPSSISSLTTENLVSSTHESTTESNNDVSTTLLTTSSVIPTQISDIASEKKRPVLFHPRPFSARTESTAKPTTVTTTITSKVSQSNLRFRLRQTSSPTTTTEAIITTIRSRSRGRINNFNRNLNEDRDQEEKIERTEGNKPARNRKRGPVVTEKYVDYNEESDRKYRPADLADLSSLTAADLNRGVGEFVSAHKSRRPVASFATTTTQKSLDVFEKADSRPLPLVRKSIDPLTIGRTRRIVPKTDDQLNASSDQAATTRKIVRGFRSTTSKTIVQESDLKVNKTLLEDSVRVTRPRKVFRRVRPISSTTTETTSNNALPDEALTTSTTVRTVTLVRKRIPLYRVRPRKNETLINSVLDETPKITEERITSENPLIELFNTKSRFDLDKNNTTEDDEEDISNEHVDVLNGEEGENIKLSESNIRESSQINSFGFDEKPNRGFSKSRKDNFLKPSIENQNKELTLSDKLEIVTEKQESVETTTIPHIEIPQTAPNRIIRTRKIIRKITTTKPTTTTEKSKRRLTILSRPQPTNIIDSETKPKNEDTEPSDKEYFTIGRSTTELPSLIPEKASKIEEAKSRRIFRPSFGGRTTTEKIEIENEENEPETNIITSPRTTTSTESSSVITTKYSPKLIPTLSTTEYYENDDDNIDDEIYGHIGEEEDDAEGDDDDDDEYDNNNHDLNEMANDEGIEDMPRYTIYSTSSVQRTHNFESNVNFDDSNEEDMDDDLRTNQSVSSFIYTTAPNSRNESETFVNKEKNLITEKNEERKLESRANSNNNIEKTEITTKRNNLIRSQKDRPSFTRQKPILRREKLQTKSPKDVLKASPRYRSKFTTLSPSIRPATSTSIRDQLETTESEINESYDIDTKSNVDEITMPTFLEHLTTTEDDDLTTLNDRSQENYMTDETLVATTQELKDSTLIQVTEESTNPTQINEIDDTTVHLDSEDVTSTIGFTTSLTLIDEDSTMSVTETSESPTEIASTNLTETTTEYRRRSTLRPIKERPRLGYSQRTLGASRLSTTTNPSIEVSSRKSYTRSNLFGKNRLKPFLREKVTTPPGSTTGNTILPLSLNTLLYKYSTTERNEFNPDGITEEEDDRDFENDEENDHDDDIDSLHEDDEKPMEVEESIQTSKVARIVNSPVDTKTFKSSLNKPKFIKTLNKATPISDKVVIDTEAIKDKNKNLFSKRKMNIPFKTNSPNTNDVTAGEDYSAPKVLSNVDIADISSTPSSIQSDTTDPNLTTLHHIFADIEDADTTTESMGIITSTNPGKAERLIEVNRIAEFKTKQTNHSGVFEVTTKAEIVPTVDKIGEISRITLIKIVDGNNETIIKDSNWNEIGATIESSSPSPVYIPEETKVPFEIAKVEEIPASEVIQNVNLKNIELEIKMDDIKPYLRDDRKYEIFGESKVFDSNKVLTNIAGKPEIIDGTSHINVVSARPSAVETSTISLQGLFQTEKPHLNPGFTSNDEVLETGPSELIQVRVLDQDKSVNLAKGSLGNTNYIPVRVLPQEDEEVTMKAHVVEIKPKLAARTIRIVPITVEMSSLTNIKLPPNKNDVKT